MFNKPFWIRDHEQTDWSRLVIELKGQNRKELAVPSHLFIL
ncbi:hypothetical protein [Paenibacillus sp.]|nr:hypothetical protein [Paenibacillus sp.]